MHQHSRRVPTALPMADPTRSTRDPSYLHPSSPTHGSGSSEDFVNTREQQVSSAAATTHRLNQIIQNLHTKAALIILHGRANLTPATSRKTGEQRVNKWFNIEVDETEDYNTDIRLWRTCDTEDARPPPLIIETYITTDPLPAGQRLVILDDDNKRWDVYNSLEGQREGISHRTGVARQILLERWTIKLSSQAAPLPSDLVNVLPIVYKKSIVLFRALYTYANFLPAHRLMKKLGRGRAMMGIKIGYRIVSGDQISNVARADNLRTPLTASGEDVTTDYSFGSTETPAGVFSIDVRYRTHADFRIDETDELLSSRFLGADRGGFPTQQASHVGSLPVDQRRNLLERPELGHAYGSMATFHQAGIDPGTSPVSVLRQAQEFNRGSPSPSANLQPVQSPPSRPAPSRSVTTGRRSSFNLPPFKTPSLSQSPLGSSPLAASPRVSSTRIVPTLGSLTEEPSNIPPEPIRSITSSSPRPQPSQRFTSSFSHRRNRPSIDRQTIKTEEDQTSSGKQSATSSQQPGSGLVPQVTGSDGSAESIHDAENVQDFLNMLEGKKDLLATVSPSAITAANVQTAIALSKYHKMRDTNTALSESMSSSLVVSKSASRQAPLAVPSTSSSPNKPASPHTPHTPFAPSRLSAAYSHDDFKDAAEEIEPEQQIEEPGDTQGIDIPSSPRRYVPGYRRSSSVQRRSSNEDDIADLYGLKSHSMGSKSRKDSETFQPRHQRQNSQAVMEVDESTQPAIAANDGATSTNPQPRFQPQISPAQGSISSTSHNESRSSTIGSWQTRRGSRQQNPALLALQKKRESGEEDDDSDLPFIMDIGRSR